MYYLNRHSYKSDDEVYWAFADIDVSDCTSDMFDEIVAIFKTTADVRLRNLLACFMAETKNEKALSVIMDVLERIKYSNHSATLIYAVDEFDCSNYYELFIDICIAKKDEARYQCMWLIRDTKYRTIRRRVKINCLSKIEAFLNTLNADSENYDYRDMMFLRELINGLDERP